MGFRMLRSELAVPLSESGGWPVVDFLNKRWEQRDEMPEAQRDVLALGNVFMNIQWDGVYLALANLGPVEVRQVIDAAERVGRNDMARTLSDALQLIPGGCDGPHEESPHA
jgi:hypothetical protein